MRRSRRTPKKLPDDYQGAGVAEKFSQMSGDAKSKFVKDTAAWLTNMADDPRQLQALFKGMDKNQMSMRQHQIIEQVTVSLTFSFKPEYQYPWTRLIYKLLNYQFPETMSIQEKEIDKLHFLHIPLKDKDLKEAVEDMAIFYGGWDNLWGAVCDALKVEEEEPAEEEKEDEHKQS